MKCWKDFSGKPVFFTPAGFMNWLNFQRIFKALNYDFKHVQIDVKANADALDAGTVVGSVAYTTSGSQLSSYWKETEIRTDVKVVNPCDDEVAKLKQAGLLWSTSIPKARSPRTSARRCSKACRSCSPITPAPTCRKTWSTRWSRRSTTRRTSW